MSALFAELAAEARAWLGLEGIAVAAAVLYLVLAIREHRACWYFAALSSALYVYILFAARLYMESGLSVFYFAMAVYGWLSWTGGSSDAPLRVTRWPGHWHAAAIGVVTAMSLCSGFLLAAYTDAAFPYIDSMTTWAALWATFLVARKVLENWWYWFVIDTVLVVMFSLRGLELTALLYVVYLVMIPFGYVEWRRSWRAAEGVTGERI